MRAATGVDREARALEILEEEGLRARVRSVGTDGEIAAIGASLEEFEALQRIAPRLRSLGYRYVAVDLVDPGHRNRGTR